MKRGPRHDPAMRSWWGNIAEQGTHDELMEIEDGIYAGLYQYQFRG